MKKILLSSEKKFYKANLHCHTNFSDGALSPAEVKEEYKGRGYSVVAFTDHDILIPHDELNDERFLALHGFEVEVNENQQYPGNKNLKTCHICMVAIDPDNLTQPLWGERYAYIGNTKSHIPEVKRDTSLPDYERIYSTEGITEIMTRGREAGFFVTYNHPTWSRETYNEYMDYHGMHAFEIMNGSCLSTGFDDYNPRVYDDILSGGERIYCIGADDNHNSLPKHPKNTRKWDSGVAFTVINSPSLDYRDVTCALLDGNFYASEAPEIYELTYEDGKVNIKTSPADSIKCTFGVRGALCEFSEGGVPVTEATFDIPDDNVYFRITVTDERGRHACTNAYFLDELKK